MSAKSREVGILECLPVYFVLLSIAAVEIYVAYRRTSLLMMLAILLTLSLCGSLVAIIHFMSNARGRWALYGTVASATIVLTILLRTIWTNGLHFVVAWIFS